MQMHTLWVEKCYPINTGNNFYITALDHSAIKFNDLAHFMKSYHGKSRGRLYASMHVLNIYCTLLD